MKRGGYSEALLKKIEEREKARKEAEAKEKASKEAEAKARLEAGFQKQFESLIAARRVPRWVVAILQSVAASHGINQFHIVSRNFNRATVAARHDAIYRIKAARPTLSTPRIGSWFCIDHTSVLYALTRHAEKHGLPKFSKYRIAHERRRKAAIRHFDMKRAA